MPTWPRCDRRPAAPGGRREARPTCPPTATEHLMTSNSPRTHAPASRGIALEHFDDRPHGSNGHGAGVPWAQVRDDLQLAEQNALLGAAVPDMPHRRGLRGWLARQVARGVLFASRVLTNRQRQFNVAVLSALRALAGGLRRVEERVPAREVPPEDEGPKGGEVEARLADHAARLRSLESSLRHARAALAAQEHRL